MSYRGKRSNRNIDKSIKVQTFILFSLCFLLYLIALLFEREIQELYNVYNSIKFQALPIVIRVKSPSVLRT